MPDVTEAWPGKRHPLGATCDGAGSTRAATRSLLVAARSLVVLIRRDAPAEC
jgi:hypothetical protein